ncbi:MAG: alanine--tRNA ligase, partial [Candidatus Marinimicrobia bacterium]|nr:alanine--tRNA ligase [Candidatus Neomarinimicrobiota bacterium]
MKSQKLRLSFLDFFVKQHGHIEVPSSSVIPENDPSLLFTNAGMNQFKAVFLGQEEPIASRVVNVQKCIRVSGKHNDLEEVGKDDYHHTFFEMLGNWSFGDYYKAEAIEWAWELLTDVWNLPKERLFATVFYDDDESYDLWKKISGLPESKILRFGEKDNFWDMGNTGPCGPCSEIHYYRGSLKDGIDASRINMGDPRYIELWNLVFIQYFRDEKGLLHSLSNKHVDTGAGFERLLGVLNGVSSNYETDLFKEIIYKIESLCGKLYDRGPEGMPFRVIADHVRMLSFCIADGVVPSNEGRGYVLRRILRRAARYGKKIGLNDPFLYMLVPGVAKIMGDAYPELIKHEAHIASVLKNEENSFLQTLDRGLAIFEDTVLKANKNKMKILPGEDVFKLYDTYGFPVDLTRLLAEEKGFQIDEGAFYKLMEEQKKRARQAGSFKESSISFSNWVLLDPEKAAKETEFVGYETLNSQATLIKFSYREDKTFLVFDKTPFYAESGGQIGDCGFIIFGNKKYRICDTQKEGNQFIHIVDEKIPHEDLMLTAQLHVDETLRQATARNHTGTHLLHAALRYVLGTHVHQAGSYVSPTNLRFDFNFPRKVTSEELKKIQDFVNDAILSNIPVTIRYMSYQEAIKQGATALFGEKYGNKVRTVKVDDISFELCGGTHVKATGDIGYFIILNESSIASGVRRIEAVTGKTAHQILDQWQEVVENLSSLLKANPKTLASKVESLINQVKSLEKETKVLKAHYLVGSMGEYLKNPEFVGSIPVYTAVVDVNSIDELKHLGDKVRENLKSGIVFLGMENDSTSQVLCVVTEDLVKKGYHAGKLAKRIGQELGGGGGGRPHMAIAGGKKSTNF